MGPSGRAFQGSSRTGRRYTVLSTIALLIGALAALPEFIGGAHPLVVLTTLIVAAGVSFYVLERLNYLVVWLAIVSALAFVAVTTRQILASLDAKAWVAYRLADVFRDIGVTDLNSHAELMVWLLKQPAGLITATVSVLFAVTGAYLWPWRRGRGE